MHFVTDVQRPRRPAGCAANSFWPLSITVFGPNVCAHVEIRTGIGASSGLDALLWFRARMGASMLKRSAFAGAILVSVGSLHAASLSENFDSLSATVLIPAGWTQTNRSSPVGPVGWFPQSQFTTPPGPHAGTNAEAVNFQSGSGTSTLSNWLILPVDTWSNGDTIDFWTRSLNTATVAFPDRMQVRFSPNGASTNVGTLATDVGDFTQLLLDINPALTAHGYPEAWTLESIAMSGLGGATSGRLAFRYFVTNGGPSGANSNAIMIDDLLITPVPEPASMGVLTMSLAGLALKRRGR
jgi:hypothetical protein